MSKTIILLSLVLLASVCLCRESSTTFRGKSHRRYYFGNTICQQRCLQIPASVNCGNVFMNCCVQGQCRAGGLYCSIKRRVPGCTDDGVLYDQNSASAVPNLSNNNWGPVNPAYNSATSPNQGGQSSRGWFNWW